LDRFGSKPGYWISSICTFIFIASVLKAYRADGSVTGNAFIAFAFIALRLAVATVPTPCLP